MSSGRVTYVQDPAAELDYVWDWAEWLGEDTIASASVAAEPDGLTVDRVAVGEGSQTVTAWFAGGSEGATYAVTCHIVTAAGRVDERTVYVRIQDR